MLDAAVRVRLETLLRVARPAAARPDDNRSAIAAADALAAAERRDRLPSGEVVATPSGRHHAIRTPLARIWPAAADCCWNPAVGGGTARAALPLASDLAALADALPERALFLDLETCGFAGAMVFLVGLVRSEGGTLVLDQRLARTYAEESSILDAVWPLAAEAGVLVTFNGKSFDWPQLRDRGVYHRRPRLPQVMHVDLLHHARRRWRGVLPNCRLETLERHVCGRLRRGDIPGREIPLVYHEFVRSGNARRIRGVLHHNALDLVTLVELAARLCEPGLRQASA